MSRLLLANCTLQIICLYSFVGREAEQRYVMFHTMRSCASEHVNVCAYRQPMNSACNQIALAKVEASPCAWNGDALSRARVRMIFFCDNAIISQIRKKIVGQDNVCRLGYIGSYVMCSFSHCSYRLTTLSFALWMKSTWFLSSRLRSSMAHGGRFRQICLHNYMHTK